MAVKAIAKLLNEQETPSHGLNSVAHAHGRAHPFVKCCFRAVYRGEIVWAQTRKRDKWGRKHQHARAENEWIRVSAPTFRLSARLNGRRRTHA